MRISNEQYFFLAGFFHLLISVTYAVICISNYRIDWLSDETLTVFKNVELFALKNPARYEPALTWGLAGFNAILLVVFVVLYHENKVEQKPKFNHKEIWIGFMPFAISLLFYFAIDYSNLLIIVVTGVYSFLTLLIIDYKQIRFNW